MKGQGKGQVAPTPERGTVHSGQRRRAEEGREAVPACPRLPPALGAALRGPAQEAPGMARSQGPADDKEMTGKWINGRIHRYINNKRTSTHSKVRPGLRGTSEGLPRVELPMGSG